MRPLVFGGLVDLSGIVSSIADDSLHVVSCVLDYSNSGFGVIDVGARERLGDDDPTVVDSEMQLLPALKAPLAMFGGRPLAFTDHREAGAVDDQVNRAELKLGLQLDLQGFAPAREGGVVRDIQIDAHEFED